MKRQIHNWIMRYAYRHANLTAGWNLLWEWTALPPDTRAITSPPVPGRILSAMLEQEDK